MPTPTLASSPSSMYVHSVRMRELGLIDDEGG